MTNPGASEPRPWQLLGRRLLLAAPPWLTVHQERVALPTGRVIDDYYRIVLPEFAVVLPRTAAGEYVLVRGYKHGLGRLTLMAPAGLIDPGEEPLAAARRELLEETGYEAPDWEALGCYVVDGNRQCGRMHLFAAGGAVRRAAAHNDEMEQLQVVLMSRAELLAALRAGEFGTLAGGGGAALALLLAA
jgi:ADP-ribose pyrophosphatase